MINFKIEVIEGRYFISEIFEGKHKKELPSKYLKIFILVLWDMRRLIRLGKLFHYLVIEEKEIIISEYDILCMIKIFYTKRYNLSSGKWLIEYYQEAYKYASYELGKILPN